MANEERYPPFFPNATEYNGRPPKFQVKVVDDFTLFSAVEFGISGKLGKELMPRPLESVAVELDSDGSTFNFVARITFDPQSLHEEFNGVRLDTTKICFDLAKRFQVFHDDDGLIPEETMAILGSNLSIFVLHSGLDHEDVIQISSKLTKKNRFDGTDMEIIQPPLVSWENYKSVLPDFAEVVGTMVDECYHQAGINIAPMNLYLTSSQGFPHTLLHENESSLQDFDMETETREFDVVKTSFEDVGGQEEAKRELQDIIYSVQNPEIYEKWGTKGARGVILHGPEGTGKTLLVKALAEQSGIPFVHIVLSDLVSKWYGESEQNVASYFRTADGYEEGAIIFMDEIDAISHNRDTSHEVSGRILTTFLEKLDGLVSNKKIIFIAATNKLESIDKALLRPGRIDRIIEVPLPNAQGRKQIFHIHMNKAEQLAGRKLFSSLDTDDVISALSEGFNGADIAEIVRRVLEEKIRIERTGASPTLVTKEDIVNVISKYERQQKRPKYLGFLHSQEGF